MRADRLVSLMLLLQTHGKISAEALARQLEVSVRTIYRDMNALCVAGIPVYTERGPDGGCCLLEDYRTTLTGMTVDEIKSLSMLSIPEPLKSLEAGQTLQKALIKLFASMPSVSSGGDSAHQRIYLDWAGWRVRELPVHQLETIYRAVYDDLRIQVVYPLLNLAETAQVVEPYGLVGKAGIWYAVCNLRGKIVAHRVSDFADVKLAGEHFQRPPGFDLIACWQRLCDGFMEDFFRYRVVLLVSPQVAAQGKYRFGDNSRAIITHTSRPRQDGWVEWELRFDHIDSARETVLGLGSGVQVIEPEALRLSVIDYARQVLRTYRIP